MTHQRLRSAARLALNSCFLAFALPSLVIACRADLVIPVTTAPENFPTPEEELAYEKASNGVTAKDFPPWERKVTGLLCTVDGVRVACARVVDALNDGIPRWILRVAPAVPEGYLEYRWLRKPRGSPLIGATTIAGQESLLLESMRRIKE